MFLFECVDENGIKDFGLVLLLYLFIQVSLVEVNDNEDDCLFIIYLDWYDILVQYLIFCFSFYIGWYLVQIVEMFEEFDEEEFLLIVDLMVIYLGFGVICLNILFDSQSDGEFGWYVWFMECYGFLIEGMIIFVILVFVEFVGIEVECVWVGFKF